jgi:hypothetical protein
MPASDTAGQRVAYDMADRLMRLAMRGKHRLDWRVDVV